MTLILIIMMMLMFFSPLAGADDSTKVKPLTNGKAMRLITQTFTTMPAPQDNLVYPLGSGPTFTMSNIPADWTCNTGFKKTPTLKNTTYVVCLELKLSDLGGAGWYTVLWGKDESKYIYNYLGECGIIKNGTTTKAMISEVNNIVFNYSGNSTLTGAYFHKNTGTFGHPGTSESCACMTGAFGYKTNFSSADWMPVSPANFPRPGTVGGDIYQIVCEKWVES